MGNGSVCKDGLRFGDRAESVHVHPAVPIPGSCSSSGVSDGVAQEVPNCPTSAPNLSPWLLTITEVTTRLECSGIIDSPDREHLSNGVSQGNFYNPVLSKHLCLTWYHLILKTALCCGSSLHLTPKLQSAQWSEAGQPLLPAGVNTDPGEVSLPLHACFLKMCHQGA